MPTTPMNFIKGDKVGSETDYRDALPVNMTAVNRPMFGVQGYMIQQPGIKQFATGLGADRGGIWDSRQQQHFRVSGTRLIRISQTGTVTELGTVPGIDTVSMDYSFNNLAVIASERMFLYNSTDGFVEVTDPHLGKPIDVCWIDQYLFMNDTENLFHTTLSSTDADDNPIPPDTGIEPTDFATSEFSPDPTYGVEKTTDNRVMVFNRYTVEFFQDDGSANFAFSRLPGRALEVGIVGTHAKAKLNNGFYVVGSGKDEAVSVYILASGVVTKVATREIEKLIAKFNDDQLRGVIVEVRVEDAYQFIIVHLPGLTLLLNVTISQQAGLDNAWSIIKSDVSGDSEYRGVHGVFDPRVSGWVYGDKRSGNIGLLDNTVATQYDEISEWILFTPYYFFDSQSIDKLEVETIPGFTVANDATVAVSTTRDGVQYGTEMFMQYGTSAEYRHRFIRYRLGYINEFVSFKLRGASRSRMAIGSGVLEHG